MSKIYIINGSPRKNWNTDKMCKNFAKGAESKGIETKIINLYDLDFKGCRSCFACKLKGSKNFGRCAYPDELTPILDKIAQADGIVFASPIYFGDVTGIMRCFIERLMFPFFQYKDGYPSTAPKKLQTAVIYTMNINEEICNQMYTDMFGRLEWFIEKLFTKPDKVIAYDTYQFPDYNKYAAELFNIEHKTKQRDEQLPKDLNRAYEAGIQMADKILKESA